MSTVEEQTGVMSQSQALALEYEDQHEIASEEENTDEEGHEGDEPGLPPAPQTLDRSVRRDLDRVNIRGHPEQFRSKKRRGTHATTCVSSTSSENLTSQNVSDVFSNDTSCQSVSSLHVVDNTDLDEESLVWAGSERRPGKNKIRTRN
ncbi:hypothetical protein ACJ73_09155 [Blastomyces percursus]|uniref:Uncharacterized protein n=1 Tax=Blastomyces percursus TaxID=1658174 RepID=A0A1J9Q0Z6_9EURO|nr:hypothetical protein ACJ73_09155 [Blastomyces percursus]